ncbi:MAG: ABC transporter permease [Cyclobacteriaceae bacterium]
MLRNFFVVTWRNLRRNGLYSTINIAGLSIGIACSILILLWVADETSYDTFIPKVNRLHQVWVNAEFDGKTNSWRSIPLPSYEALKNEHSDIVNTCVTGWGGDHLLTVGDTRIIKRGYFASKEFLQMFEYPLTVGSAETVMENPSSIVISERLGKVLFGDKNPLGEIVRVDDKSTLTVTGILKDIPTNSSFEFDYLIPWKHRESINPWVVRNKTNWGNYSFQVFVELSADDKALIVEEGIKDLITEKGQDDIPREFFLHPMPQWRLHSNFENGVATGGMSDYVQLFTIIAAFILVIACINFMNLATARSEKRVREVGIRKSLGSNRKQLISQFIGESVFISTLSYLLALLLAFACLKPFNALVEKALEIDPLSGQFWIFSVGVILITGVLSGSYPALYLSSFDPVKTLKGSVFTGKNSGTPRKVLVTLQFAFSIILMISTVVIYKQIELVKNREIGYAQENLIIVETTDAIEDNYEVLKNDLEQSGAVESVCISNSPINNIQSNNFLGWPGKPESLKVLFATISTQYDYAKTLGIKMLHGRDFSREFATDTAAIVINKTALDMMDLGDDPIGTQLDLWGAKRKLIGVTEDVLMGSPYDAIRPAFFVLNPDWVSYVTVRLKKTNDLQASLNTVESIFNTHNPAYPFDYKFVDEEFAKKFTTISLTQKLATIFSLLAIFITGLGLFGLASYTAEQRIKEIGIRKVLGASVVSLVSLISREFTKLVIISFALAAPAAWYLLDTYLDRYPIRTDVPWWVFPIAGLVALAFALGIVSNQARKAALTNPAKSLRSE